MPRHRTGCCQCSVQFVVEPCDPSAGPPTCAPLRTQPTSLPLPSCPPRLPPLLDPATTLTHTRHRRRVQGEYLALQGAYEELKAAKIDEEVAQVGGRLGGAGGDLAPCGACGAEVGGGE